MTIQRNYKFGGNKGPFGSFGALIMLILFFVLLFYLAKGIFTILSWVAPALLIITAIIDYKVIINFGKFIIKLLKDNPLMGVLAIVLTVVGFPFVAGFLFFKALLTRSLKKAEERITEQREGVLTEYEEIVEDEDFLELPEMKQESRNKSDSDYQNLFD